jgi:hypothetical protein
MKTVLLTAALLLAMAGVFAEDDQAFLGIFAETTSVKMVGMPAIQLPAGTDISKIPGMAEMLAAFAPQRKLSVRLWSPGLAPAGAVASIAPPAGLKQGKKLDLELYRPQPAQTEAEGDGAVPGLQPGAHFTIKRYWGSSETVRPGQPEVTTIDVDAMTPEQKESMRKMVEQARKQSSYFYKPDWTTGYWPGGKQTGVIAKDAALPGSYALTTTYTGNVTLDVPDTVNFLPPIEIERPNLDQTPSLTEALLFHWKPVTGALGLYASMMGMQGQDTMILWSSSEIKAAGFDVGEYRQMAEVETRVASTEFMAGTRQDVAVPAGIFKDCDMVSLTMAGWGPGAARDDGQPRARMQTRTMLTSMLGGKSRPRTGATE